MKGAIFRVSTGLVVALGGIAFFRFSLLGWIPPLPANENLLHQPGEYMQQALHQPIQWRPLTSGSVYGDAFIESQQLDRPALVVIGAPWSQTAHTVDNAVFNSPDVANLVNRRFIPIRIDGVQQPRWLSAFLPLSRLRLTFTTGFQAFVIDPQGRVVRYIGSTAGDQDLDPTNFTEILKECLEQIANPGPPGKDIDWGRAQVEDVDELQNAEPGSLPQFGPFADSLAHDSGSSEGGFIEGNLARLMPQAWLYQLRTGRASEMGSCLDPVLLSPAVDVLGGGFFGFRKVRGVKLIDFDQVTTVNAEMAEFLAEADGNSPDSLYHRLAVDTFDMIVRDLMDDKLFDACRLADQGPHNRSDTASFPTKRLQTFLGGTQLDWAQQKLGLSESMNSQMIPYLRTRKVLGDGNLEVVLQALAKAPAPPTINGGAGCLDVSGHTAACLMRCARLLGDHDRLVKLLDTIDALDGFRRKDDVSHFQDDADPRAAETSPSETMKLGTYLGDYTAYCDAELEDYLCTGRVASFQNGLTVLQRAIELFSYGKEGVFMESLRPEYSWLPKNIVTPAVADDARESSTAQMIRLLEDYGRMLGPGAEGDRLIAIASKAVDKCPIGPVAMSPKLAGFYVSAARFADPQCAFAIGPNAQAMADQLFRLRPSRLVAAAVGPVRPRLQGRKPGVYVANGTIVSGPYTVEQAAGLMPKTYQVGVTNGP